MRPATGLSISDLAGNGLDAEAAPTGPIEDRYTLDNSAPTVTAIVRLDPDPATVVAATLRPSPGG